MTDPIWVTAFRVVHISAGFMAFFLAPAALITVKGGKQHRSWGKIYFWMMAVVAATALGLSVYRPISFTTLVAVFSFYMAFSGYRVLFRKRPEQGQGPTMLDWIGSILVLLASLALIVLAVWQPTPLWNKLALVALAFGATGLFFGGGDTPSYWRQRQKKTSGWLDLLVGGLERERPASARSCVFSRGFLA